MKELRCLVFTDREVVDAILDRRRRLKESLPPGEVKRIRFTLEGGVRTTLSIENEGTVEELQLTEQEVQAALISHCMAKGVPLPVEADKALYLIRGNATLMITLNFRKPARLVAQGAA
ncbi:MAG TPA: hypothetical protein VED40_15805 [Azospirillaceae bacterium]|nr:hypothetical protein [Azospirillaceae bacterium]